MVPPWWALMLLALVHLTQGVCFVLTQWLGHHTRNSVPYDRPRRRGSPVYAFPRVKGVAHLSLNGHDSAQSHHSGASTAPTASLFGNAVRDARKKREAQLAEAVARQEKRAQQADRDEDDEMGNAGTRSRLVRLKHPFLGAVSLKYTPATGVFTFDELPWVERRLLAINRLPWILRGPLLLLRPLYAPLWFCKWLGLQWTLYRRGVRRTIFVPPPLGILTFHTIRSVYLVVAIVMITIMLDDVGHTVVKALLKLLTLGRYDLIDSRIFRNEWRGPTLF